MQFLTPTFSSACGPRGERLRAEHDIYARRRRRFIATTRPRRTPGVPNLVDQRFYAPRPNRIWVTDVTFIATRLDRQFDVQAPNQASSGDITFVWTGKRWAYLAMVLDLFARRPVGWALSLTVDSELTRKALTMAYESRGNPEGEILQKFEDRVGTRNGIQFF